MKYFPRQLFISSLLFLVSSAALADPVKWYLQGVTMSDGGRAIGSFVYDSDTDQYTEIDIATTAGENLAGSTYGDPNPDSASDSTGLLTVSDGSAQPLTGQPMLVLGFVEALGNAGGTVAIDPVNSSFEGECGRGAGGDMRECGTIVIARDITGGLVTSTRPGATLNAGMNGSWYNEETSGQGILIDVFADIPLVFLAWFTFDVEPAPAGATATIGDPNHRWLTGQGTFRGNEAVLDMTLTTGGLFNNPTEVTNSNHNSYGRIVLTYNPDCRTGTMEYEFFSQGLSGTIAIERIVDSNVALCLELDTQ